MDTILCIIVFGPIVVGILFLIAMYYSITGSIIDRVSKELGWTTGEEKPKPPAYKHGKIMKAIRKFEKKYMKKPRPGRKASM